MRTLKSARESFRRAVVWQIGLLVFFHFATVKAGTSKDIMFLLDQSASMKEGDLFNHVKSTLKSYIAESSVGDRIILIGFEADATELADMEISQTSDVTELLSKVARLEANGQWTYMTKALARAARRLEDLQRAYPDRPKMVYILTDGHNEPPPPDDGAVKFEDILRDYFETYTRELTYVYVLSYTSHADTERPRNDQLFLDSIHAMPSNIDRDQDESKIEQVWVEVLSGLVFRYQLSAEETIEDTVTFVTGLTSLPSPVGIRIEFEPNPLVRGIATPEHRIKGSNEVMILPFRLKSPGADGTYKAKVVFTASRAGVIVTPPSYEVRFEISSARVKPETEPTPISTPPDEEIGNVVKGQNGNSIGPALFVALAIAGVALLFVLVCKLRRGFDRSLKIVVVSTEQTIFPAEEQGFCKRTLYANQNLHIDPSFDSKTMRIQPGGYGSIKVTLLEERDDVLWDNEPLLKGTLVTISAPARLQVSGGDISIELDVPEEAMENVSEEV